MSPQMMKKESLVTELLPPTWAIPRGDGWQYAGWIPYEAEGLETLIKNSLRSDHGETRGYDIYQEGFVFWWRENV